MLHELARIAPAICALIAGASSLFAQTTTCANLRPDGFPCTGLAREPSISGDGRWLAFSTNATDLGAPSSSGFSVYVRDLATGAIVLVSADPSGAAASGNSSLPLISADGRWVAFSSTASTLVAGDTNSVSDVFLRDLVNGVTTRVSVTSAGVQSALACTVNSISADGRVIAFETREALVASDTNGMVDVYVRDRVAGVTSRVSVSSTGTQAASFNCSGGSISADGNRVAFTSNAGDLVTGDTNGLSDVFVHDRALGTTVIASVSPAGAVGNLGSFTPTLSGDGTKVAFISVATNLVTQPLSPVHHAFVRDLVAGTTAILDTNASGTPGGDAVYTLYRIAVSHDGRYAAFASISSNLVAGDTNLVYDAFVKDRLTGAIVRASSGAIGQQLDEGNARGPALSDDGTRVAFFTEAENLLPADGNVNHDVFVRDLSAPSAGSALCFGDGTGAACPCNNNGFSGRGCAHSAEPKGAELFALGTARVSSDTLRLGARELPNGMSCIFFQGSALQSALFGDGLRCAGGTVHRLATKLVSGILSAHFPGVGDAPISSAGAIPAGGATRFYQLWYRNTAAYCTVETFNLTNAVQVIWTP